MAAFPANPSIRAALPSELGNILAAAKVAGVRPDTIRIWMRRGKVAPILSRPGHADLFHLPTVRAAAEAGAKHRLKLHTRAIIAERARLAA